MGSTFKFLIKMKEERFIENVIIKLDNSRLQMERDQIDSSQNGSTERASFDDIDVWNILIVIHEEILNNLW